MEEDNRGLRICIKEPLPWFPKISTYAHTFFHSSANDHKPFLKPFFITTKKMSPPYPTAHQIEEMFANRNDPPTFNTYFADNSDIILVGKNQVLGGNFKSGQHFDDEIFHRIGDALKPGTLRLEVLRVIGDGEAPWAAVNSVVTAMSKYGEYHGRIVPKIVRNWGVSNAVRGAQISLSMQSGWTWYVSTLKGRLRR